MIPQRPSLQRARVLAARPAFWLAMAFVLMMALLPHPPRFPLDRFGDKAEHAAAFAVLAVLAACAWPRLALWRVLAALSLVGALIELAQAIPALHRDCELNDWLADTLAVAAALAGVALWRAARGPAPGSAQADA